MKHYKNSSKPVSILIKAFSCCIVFLSCVVYANEQPETERLIPTDSKYADWTFTGLVSNDAGDQFGYFFHLERAGTHFKTHAALFEQQTGEPILQEQSEATLNNLEKYNWQVGNAFLRFNPITESWIFGMQTREKKGFNFKVDMLSQPEKKPDAKTLRSGIEVIVNQTSRLNGHIDMNAEKQNQFVTAKHAWFQQVWLMEKQEKKHPFFSVLCRFNDGSGFYSVNMREVDAKQGAITGAYDAKSKPVVVSQFIHLKQDSKTQNWHIRLASPKMNLVFSDLLPDNQSLHAGFVELENKSGFCSLQKEELGGNHAEPPYA